MILPIVFICISLVTAVVSITRFRRKEADLSAITGRFLRVMPGIAWVSFLLGIFFFPLGHVY